MENKKKLKIQNVANKQKYIVNNLKLENKIKNGKGTYQYQIFIHHKLQQNATNHQIQS